MQVVHLLEEKSARCVQIVHMFDTDVYLEEVHCTYHTNVRKYALNREFWPVVSGIVRQMPH